MEKSHGKSLADNLLWLMSSSADLGSQARVGARAKIDQTTIGRILSAKHSPTLDKIAGLAAAFSIEPWQLLAPRLGADLYRLDADRRMVPIITRAPPPDSLPERRTPTLTVYSGPERRHSGINSLEPSGRKPAQKKPRAR